jgi:hypothetical protein
MYGHPNAKTSHNFEIPYNESNKIKIQLKQSQKKECLEKTPLPQRKVNWFSYPYNVL